MENEPATATTAGALAEAKFLRRIKRCEGNCPFGCPKDWLKYPLRCQQAIFWLTVYAAKCEGEPTNG